MQNIPTSTNFLNDHPVTAAVNRLADQLRARRLATLADPNAPPLSQMIAEAQQRAELLDQTQQPKPIRTRKRRPTLAAVARQAAKAGITVAAYDVRPDGTIKIVTGKPVGADQMDDTASSDPKWN